MTKINIIFLDTQPGTKNDLCSILDDETFNVTYAEDIHPGSFFNPELILCKITGKDADEDAFNTLKSINPNNNVPVLFISSADSVESYIQKFSRGVFHHINIPFKKEFLYKKIFAILNKYLDGPDTDCRIEFEYYGKRNNLSLSNTDLTGFIASSMENYVHQNSILRDMLAERDPSMVKTLCLDAEFFDKKKHILEYDVRRALDNDEFFLYYQPVISLADNELLGFEALIRWQHPERGFVNPDQFINIIEDSPLIIPIGYRVIEKAVAQLKEWKKRFERNIRLSLNLSTKQFLTENLPENISEIIKKAGISHEDISFEITETAFTEDIKTANITLLTLKSQKFRLYMDDFGTGYSSLTYLLHFPVDSIKIDKSFVQWMNIDEQSAQIVKSVIYLGHNLGMTVIAEGVETKEHLEKLKEFGCDFGQGYYFAKPLPAEDAGNFIEYYNKPIL